MQSTIGNQAVQRLLQSRSKEEEADRASAQVMRMPDWQAERVQSREGGPIAAPIPYEGLAGPGEPLSAATRGFMEPRFGHDFSHVRVHTDRTAGELAQRLLARAFTIGDRIFFAPGEFQPDHTKGKQLLAHELTHVVQQSECGQAHIQRSPGPDVAMPEWAITSAEPLSGVPVPGYEQPRASYTEEDQNHFATLLDAREKDNNLNVGNFLGDYSSALLTLWTMHATEAMATAAAESGLSGLGKLLKFVIQESVIAISGFWAVRGLGHLGVEVVKLMTAAAEEIVGGQVESAVAGSDVEKTRAEIDSLTKMVAEHLKALTVDVVGLLGGMALRGYRLGKASTADLGRFRLPPLFPDTPTKVVEAAVAQAIVGQLFGSWNYPRPDEKNVITMTVEPSPDLERFAYPNYVHFFVSVPAAPSLNAAQTLATKLRGRPIKEMPNVPLHITLASNENPVDVVRAALGGMDDLALLGTFRQGQNMFGGYIEGSESLIDPSEVFVKAYPSKSPAVITRDGSGNISVLGGGLMEHLYLAVRVRPIKNLAQVIRELQMPQSPDLAPGALKTEAVSVEALAGQVHSYLFSSIYAGAEAFVSETIEPMNADAKNRK
ncbi:MAG: eCIS core domain-containing protein [Thermoanaerobaculia bacterium]